jgi:ketosteroid isomerase-like protein
MKPKDILLQWVEVFNNADTDEIADLYDDNATNHQVANMPIVGKQAIKKMFCNELKAVKCTVLLRT